MRSVRIYRRNAVGVFAGRGQVPLAHPFEKVGLLLLQAIGCLAPLRGARAALFHRQSSTTVSSGMQQPQVSSVSCCTMPAPSPRAYPW